MPGSPTGRTRASGSSPSDGPSSSGPRDAKRAAWAWRRYVQAARGLGSRAVEVRYEHLAARPARSRGRAGEPYSACPTNDLAAALAASHGASIGRYADELTEDQLAAVEKEAGPLLRELEYLQ